MSTTPEGCGDVVISAIALGGQFPESKDSASSGRLWAPSFWTALGTGRTLGACLLNKWQ